LGPRWYDQDSREEQKTQYAAYATLLSMNCNYRQPSQVISKGSNPVTLARLFPSLNPIRTEGSISDWISADKTTVQ
jgi:hypothetical protein